MLTKIRRHWQDRRLPDWMFCKSGCNAYIGINETLNLTVEGDSKSKVQEIAAEVERIVREDISSG